MHWIRVDRYYQGDALSPRGDSPAHAVPALWTVPLVSRCAPCRPPTIAPTASIRWPTTVAWALAIAPTTAPTRSDAFNFLDFTGENARGRCSWPSIPRSRFVRAAVMEKCTFCVQRIRNAEQVGRSARNGTSTTKRRGARVRVGLPGQRHRVRKTSATRPARWQSFRAATAVSTCWRNWAPSRPSPTWPRSRIHRARVNDEVRDRFPARSLGTDGTSARSGHARARLTIRSYNFPHSARR